MSTRGCLVKLEKEVCKVAYLHYGADFVNHNIYKMCIENGYWDLVFDAAKEWDEYEGEENFFYREITDPETIERLHKYDDNVLDVDAEVFIFVELLPETKHRLAVNNVTIKKSMVVDKLEVEESCSWWTEERQKEHWEKEKDTIRTCVGVKSAKYWGEKEKELLANVEIQN